MKKIISSTVTSAIALAMSSFPVLAQKIEIKDAAPSSTVQNLTISGLVSGLIKLLVIAAAVVFFFMLVLGGIKWIMSGGDKQKTEEARNQITAALVGLVVVFAAWAIAQLIKALFKVDIFDLTLPSF